MNLKKTFLLFLFLLSWVRLSADTIYLKNGRSIEGIVRRHGADHLELEVCSGTVTFKNNEIEKIEETSVREHFELRHKWEKQKSESRNKSLMQRFEEELKPKKTGFSQDSRGIIVTTLLNKKIEVSLILDTGANVIMLRRSAAEKLGVNLAKIKPDMRVVLADGRQVSGKRIILESVKVEDVEANNVEAGVLLDEAGDLGEADGLLGMSFLGKFNFTIDHKEKKLILERL